MATFSISFDTGAVPLSRIYDAFAVAYGYQATLPGGGTNPETKAQFARRMMGDHIKGVVKAQEREAARSAAEAGVTDITLT